MKILELFSGYGTASFALKSLGIPYELVGYSDIDKYANQVFKQNHCPYDEEDKLRLGDVTQINPDDLEDFDLLTGGFPCQDVSVAGKGDLSKGRTILFNEIIRIAEVKQPRYMLLENVKGLLSKRHREFYEYTLNELNRIGYEVFMVYDERHKENRVPVLNTKDFGIPQNRERVWYICFREEEDLLRFELPKKEELKILLKDVLEDNVDDKYLWSEERIKGVIKSFYNDRNPQDINHICKTLKVGGDARSIYDYITSKSQPVVFDVYHFLFGEKRPISTYVPDNNKVHRCLQCGIPKEVLFNEGNFRKLTPKECFRLQGFLNDEIDISGISDTQAYKLAGNGQTVTVVEKIFKEMFK